MIRLNRFCPLALTALVAVGHAQTQTPPVQPKVSPVQTPPDIVLPPPPGPSAIKAGSLTAAEAARIALQHQPQVAIAQAALKAAHGDVLIAEQALLPQVTATGSYASVYALPVLGPVHGSSNISSGFQSSISATQLLFDFGRTLDTVKQAEATEKASGFNLSATESDIVLQVKQAFYSYVEALRAVDAAQANLKDRNDNLALAQARLDSGLGAPSDLVTAHANLDSSTIALITAKNAASTAEVALALSMGIDPRTPVTPADSEEPSLVSDNVGGLVDQAMKNRPEIKQQESAIRAAGFGLSFAKKGLLPSLLAVGSVTDNPASPNFPRTGSIGLSLTWTPFDLVGTRGRVVSAEAAKASAQATLQQTILTVVSDVSNAYLNLRAAEQRVTVSTSEIANATEGLRIAEGQYKAGVATFVVVTDAEANLAIARQDQVTAIAALQLSRAALEHALGQAL